MTLPSKRAVKTHFSFACCWSAQDGKPARAGQFIQGFLHHGANVSIHLGDVGVAAEFRDNVDRPQHSRDDLGG